MHTSTGGSERWGLFPFELFPVPIGGAVANLLVEHKKKRPLHVTSLIVDG